MAPEGCRILVGLSGGADSMCLVEVLREIGLWELQAVHVHHGLRESAEADLQFVQRWCAQKQIPLRTERVDAAAFAAQSGMGIEEAARHLRYEAFAACARETGSRSGDRHCVAVAHHLEDQAETVLFHMVRGSRMPGLCGMRPAAVQKGLTIIRPLLTCTRAQIEEYLSDRGTKWREDESNEDVRYARNLLRREIVPLLEKINDKAQYHIAALAQEAAQTEEFLKEETSAAMGRCEAVTECLNMPDQADGSGRKETVTTASVLRISSLMGEPELIRRRILHRKIAETAGTARDLQSLHVQAVLDLAAKPGNGELHLSGGVIAVKRYDLLYLTPQRAADRGCGTDLLMRTQAPYPLSAGEYSARIFEMGAPMTAIPQKKYTKWFDYDKIASFPQYRTRRPGDRIVLSEDGGCKKLTRYMIDAKIPREYREGIVLPAVENDILWVPGGRISAAFQVSEDTSRILELKWKPGSILEDRENG